MTTEIIISFIFTTIAILVIPGPTIITVVSQAVAHGRKSIVPLVAGVVLGDFTAMTLSLIGLGVLLSTSAALFTVFKWMGAIYLIYLGMNFWRKSFGGTQTDIPKENKPKWGLFKTSFSVSLLNPKAIAFYLTFLPQFIDPIKPAFCQFVVLGGIFLFVDLVNAALYGLLSSQLQAAIKKQRVQKWVNRFGGSALIGAGMFTARLQCSA